MNWFNPLLLLTFVCVVCSVQLRSQTVSPIRTAELIDTFKWSGGDEAEARLDGFLIEAANRPSGRVAILFYCGKTCFYGEPEAHFTGIKQYFEFRKRGDMSKVTLIFGGFRDNSTTELWSIPDGACLPSPSPSLGTDKIVFSKKRMKRSRPYWCC